jgi:hypothetical protein
MRDAVESDAGFFSEELGRCISGFTISCCRTLLLMHRFLNCYEKALHDVDLHGALCVTLSCRKQPRKSLTILNVHSCRHGMPQLSLPVNSFGCIPLKQRISAMSRVFADEHPAERNEEQIEGRARRRADLMLMHGESTDCDRLRAETILQDGQRAPPCARTIGFTRAFSALRTHRQRPPPSC